MSITRPPFGLSTDGLRRTGQLSSATCCKSLHCLRCPQMLKTVIHISTASDFQQSVPFRASVGRRKFPKTFFGFPRKPYIPSSGWIFQMWGGGKFSSFFIGYQQACRQVIDRFSSPAPLPFRRFRGSSSRPSDGWRPPGIPRRCPP